MKNFSVALFAVAVIVTPAAFAEDRPPPEPTALESFVARPTVVLDLAEAVGGFESKDTSVTVFAILATDTSHPGERMAGLRIDLSDASSADRVYLDAAQLALLRKDLAGIQDGITELESGGAPVQVQGTGACWMPTRPTRTLCPSYRVGPKGSGLQLAAYGGRTFNYPGKDPAALTVYVERGMLLDAVVFR